ncbi:MAG: SDR family NAD(P)-dependent oxidoreductase [Nanoarchaeota archaeon]
MENKWVLITGSSKGLGKELAFVFADNNFNVVIHGRDSAKLEEVKKEILKRNVECEIVEGDLVEEETINKLENISKEKNIFVLINNAGYGIKETLEEMDENEIDLLVKTNLIAPIKLTKRLILPLEKNNGSIININSVSGLEFQQDRTIYCASKWGLRGFSETFRLEALKKGINILNIYLSRVKTRPEFEYGMETAEVVEKIYEAYKNKEEDLILDDRDEEIKKWKKRKY